MAIRVGITRFLGTNCDQDIKNWMKHLSIDSNYLWYEDQFNIAEYDFLIIPGGFSYGDYLRCGALAARTPVMKSVLEFAKKGKPILGICNGFQILCEAGLLPGVLLPNHNRSSSIPTQSEASSFIDVSSSFIDVSFSFIDQWVDIQVHATQSYFSSKMFNSQKLKLPIAHAEGRYYNESDQLKSMLDNQQIWLTYDPLNPNGSLMNIAGITNVKHNISGLMPHPERALQNWMGSVDGEFFI